MNTKNLHPPKANSVKSADLSRTCGEATIRLLSKYGVDTVFGIPGVHTPVSYTHLTLPTTPYV